MNVGMWSLNPLIEACSNYLFSLLMYIYEKEKGKVIQTVYGRKSLKVFRAVSVWIREKKLLSNKSANTMDIDPTESLNMIYL